jgi:hypothetical protein
LTHQPEPSDQFANTNPVSFWSLQGQHLSLPGAYALAAQNIVGEIQNYRVWQSKIQQPISEKFIVDDILNLRTHTYIFLPRTEYLDPGRTAL